VVGIWAGGIPETLTPQKIAAVNASMQLDEAGLQAVIKGMDEMRILPRSPRLDEIADTAAFLASERAGAINATAIHL
jgi:NAD(P)-dependent dehydrogenase (short-subunit alcohol dehydrogenase family)